MNRVLLRQFHWRRWATTTVGVVGAVTAVQWKWQQVASAEASSKAFDEEVDFVVVGAGSAGCAVAVRLAQQMPEHKTLLVEAGEDDDIPQIQTAVDYFGKVEHVFGSDRDWIFASEPQHLLGDRGMYWPRGKVVGGCSSFNTMVWLRGDPEDFEGWATKLGDPSWGYEGMLHFFKRAETHPYALSGSSPHRSRAHGDKGPIQVAPLNHPWHHPDDASHIVTRAFIAAAVGMGARSNVDFGGLKGTEGVGCNDVNARDGRRCSTSAYLKQCGAYPTAGVTETISQNPPGALRVWLKTETERLLWEGGVSPALPRVAGVEVVRGNRQIRVKARKEVILCCGAVNSPVLLLRSGIGPRDHLESVDVPVKCELPGVGQSLQDHLHVPISYRVKGGVQVHSHSNVCEGSLFWKLTADAKSPDLQCHLGTVFFHPDGFNPIGEGFTLTPSLIHPKSQGSIKLRSADPTDKPLIEPCYLSDKEGCDENILVEGVKLIRRLGQKMIEEGLDACEMHPGPMVTTDDQIRDYVRRYVSTMYHPTSTCRIGPDGDKGAVLDSDFRVRGVQGLRVVDASAMPCIIGTNTNATCVALGERGATSIVKEHST